MPLRSRIRAVSVRRTPPTSSRPRDETRCAAERGRLVARVVRSLHSPCASISSRIVRGGVTLELGPMLAAAGARGHRRGRGARSPPRTGRRPRSRAAPRSDSDCSAPAASPSASRTRPRATRGAGDERLALEAGRDDLQLVGSRPGAVDVAGRDARSRPAPRAAAPAAGRCSAAAPSTAPATGARARPGWRRPRRRRRPGRGGPARGPAADPTRRDAPPGSASSAPARSPLCSRIRPSSVSGHPSSRRR